MKLPDLIRTAAHRAVDIAWTKLVRLAWVPIAATLVVKELPFVHSVRKAVARCRVKRENARR
jgi:hypothetical protein